MRTLSPELELLRTHSLKACDRLIRQEKIKKALGWAALIVVMGAAAYLLRSHGL